MFGFKLQGPCGWCFWCLVVAGWDAQIWVTKSASEGTLFHWTHIVLVRSTWSQLPIGWTGLKDQSASTTFTSCLASRSFHPFPTLLSQDSMTLTWTFIKTRIIPLCLYGLCKWNENVVSCELFCIKQKIWWCNDEQAFFFCYGNILWISFVFCSTLHCSLRAQPWLADLTSVTICSFSDVLWFSMFSLFNAAFAERQFKQCLDGFSFL